MAAETVLEVVVRLRNELSTSLGQIKNQVDALSRSVGTAGASFPIAGVRNTGSDLLSMANSARQAMEEMQRLSSVVLFLGKAFIALEIVRWLKGLADLAVQDQRLDASLTAVAISMGVEAKAAHAAAEQVKALGFSTQSTINALTRYLRAGLPVDQFYALAVGAQTLAKAMGVDAGEALQRLTFSLQTGATRMLRMLGVQVELTTAIRRYKEQNPGAVIDQQTRSMIMLTEVQEKLLQLGKGFAGTQATIAFQMSQLKVQAEEARSALGKVLLPIYQMLIGEALQFATNTRLIGESLLLSQDRAKEFAESLRPLIEHFRHIGEFIVQHIEGIVKLLLLWGGIKVVIGFASSLVVQMGRLKLVIDAATAAWARYATAQAVAIATRGAGAAAANAPGMAVLGPNLGNLAGIAAAAATAISVAFSLGVAALIAAAVYAAKLLSDRFEELLAAAKEEQARRGAEPLPTVLPGIEGTFEQQQEKLKERLEDAKRWGAEWGWLAGKAFETIWAERMRAAIGPAQEKPLRDRLVRLTAEQIELSEKIKTEEQAINVARELGNALAEQEAGKRRDAMLVTAQQLQQERARTKEKLETVTVYDQEKQRQDEVRSKTQAQTAMEQRAKNNLLAAYEKLKISQDQIEGRDISASYRALLENVQQILKATEERGPAEERAVEKLVEGAKTYDEIAEALKFIRSTTGFTEQLTKLWIAQLTDKQARAVLKAIDDDTKEITRSIREQNKFRQELLDLQDKEKVAAEEAERALLRAGVAPEQARANTAEYNKALRETGETQRALADLTLDSFNRQERAALERYNAEIAALDRVQEVELQNIRLRGGTAEEQSQKIVESENRTAQGRIAILQKLYDNMRSFEKARVAEHEATNNKIKELDAELADNETRRQSALDAIRTKFMTEGEKNAYYIDKLKTAEMESQLALLQKDYDLAKKKNEEALGYLGQLAYSAENQQEVESKTNDLYDERKTILDKQRQVQVAYAEEQEAGLDRLQERIKGVAAELQTALAKQVVDIQFQLADLPESEITKLRAQLIEGLKDLPVTIVPILPSGQKVTPQPGLSRGGPITGPGGPTDDRVPIWASAGEFVMRTLAVDYYGPHFMAMLNSLKLPRMAYAEGGLVGAPASSDMGRRDVVDINFSVGGQKVSLMGERQQVRKLVSTLKNLQGV